ncbi:MAG TPA: CHASE3 domain-containing protein [Micromonosporaceae bacterium]|nr:CHASE3 domain-containing protein [Micromonosporaceae bacterium]
MTRRRSFASRLRGGRRWTLAGRVTALTAPAAILLAAVAVAAALTARANNDRVDTVVNGVGPIRTDSQQILVALLNQETGIRGYAINGDETYLDPYNQGVAQEQQLLADLQPRIGSDSQTARDLADVEARAAAWRSTVAVPVIAKVRAGDRAGAQAIIDASSRTQFDGIRTAVTTLQTDTQDLRDTAVRDLQRSSSQIVDQLIIAAGIVLVAGLLLALLLRRMVTDPVSKLARSVRLVAEGDFNHVIDTAGPPELAALGMDVENMRRRIVDDLRVVQRARDSVAEAHMRLEQHAAELVRSNQDLEQFAYVASHDLQEPLRKVASFCQLLQRRYAGQLDERADQYISFAVDGAHRMQRLINDLLSFSRIGRATGDFGPVDLNHVVAMVTSGDGKVGTPKGVVTWSDLPTVTGSEQLLVALFANLVSNSVKFRRPDLPPKVEISARRVGDEWEITCRDNGIGIEPEYADKIFVIFQRLHHRDAYPGTGIGLAIAQRIVDHHGGRIWADTTSTDGATIRFTLPVMPLGEAAPPDGSGQAGIADAAGTGQTDTSDGADPEAAGPAEPTVAREGEDTVATTPHPG